MKLSALDLGIVLIYLLVTLIFGFWIAKKANTNIKSYFLGGNTIPWYYLGLMHRGCSIFRELCGQSPYYLFTA